ncbi:GAF and ANTAR domain-containing protein [Arthrobacter sp. NicSoilB4]|uniref:GAF and ANTAR domain-containing protein n=1 Tax=Arthrobacter sp. NicSoilB4 TaxID=2830997 RepID=UPI001CC5FFEF|nr:GAF and ANTAR domain-containing protein [Arthrobacter sp. NicSoilB4]
MSVELPLAEEITAVFARATRLLLTEETVARALRLITDAATEAIPGAIGAGVSLINSSGLRQTTAASDAVVAAADALQYDLGEGPCITAWASGESVVVEDLALDRRWQRWSPAAATLGISSSVSSPLLSGGLALGAVKVYSDGGAFAGKGTVRLVELFAEQATLFIIHSQAREAARTLSDRLQESLAQRDTISMAKGLLMARNGTDDDAALRDLMVLSRQAGKPLALVAAELLAAARSFEN